MDGGQNGTACFLVTVDQLSAQRDLSHMDIIGIGDNDGIVADKGGGLEQGMARSHHLGLPDKGEPGVPGTDAFQLGGGTLLFEDPLQFYLPVKKILQNFFSPGGNDDNIFNARCDELVYDERDGRFVDQGQHFLGDCFGYGEKAGSVTCGNYYTFHGM